MNNTYYVRKYYANTDHLKLFFLQITILNLRSPKFPYTILKIAYFEHKSNLLSTPCSINFI